MILKPGYVLKYKDRFLYATGMKLFDEDNSLRILIEYKLSSGERAGVYIRLNSVSESLDVWFPGCGLVYEESIWE